MSAPFVSVPKEPTEAMLDAAFRASMQHLLDCINDPARAKEVGSEKMCKLTHASRYRSMLAAAPTGPTAMETRLAETLKEVLEAGEHCVSAEDDVAAMLRFGKATDTARALLAEFYGR